MQSAPGIEDCPLHPGFSQEYVRLRRELKNALSMLETASYPVYALQSWHDAKLRLKGVKEDVYSSRSRMHPYETKRLEKYIWDFEVNIIPYLEEFMAKSRARRVRFDELYPYYNYDDYVIVVKFIEKEVRAHRQIYIRTKNDSKVDPIRLARKYEEMQILFEGLSVAPVIFWTSKPNFQVIQKSWEKSVEVKNEIGEYLRQIRA
ncbi:hypothetical protein OXX59_003523 [Metschnikowia pulcherrima]